MTEIRSLLLYISLTYGALAQLGERMAGSHEVRGSIPLGSTKFSSHSRVAFFMPKIGWTRCAYSRTGPAHHRTRHGYHRARHACDRISRGYPRLASPTIGLAIATVGPAAVVARIPLNAQSKRPKRGSMASFPLNDNQNLISTNGFTHIFRYVYPILIR